VLPQRARLVGSSGSMNTYRTEELNVLHRSEFLGRKKGSPFRVTNCHYPAQCAIFVIGYNPFSGLSWDQVADLRKHRASSCNTLRPIWLVQRHYTTPARGNLVRSMGTTFKPNAKMAGGRLPVLTQCVGFRLIGMCSSAGFGYPVGPP
jgi:hypothetical protein